MPVSTAKRISIKNYQQEKCDRVTLDVPKGKREEYKAKAASLGLSLSMLIQISVESYGEQSGSNPAPITRPLATSQPAEKLSAEKKKLLADFNQLPEPTRRLIAKLIADINRQTQNQPE